MKTITTTIAAFLLIAFIGCSSTKEAYLYSGRKIEKLSKTEIKENGFRVDERIIYTNDSVPLARIHSVEFESYKGVVVQEISVTMLNKATYGAATELMRYLYTIAPKAKIEINYDNTF